MYKRPAFNVLISRLSEPRRFIQVLAGPRQVGKTTLAHQAAEALSVPYHYASADEPTLQGRVWLEQHWEAARQLALSRQTKGEAVLFLDEVQKLTHWSESVKRLWDEDTARKTRLKVVLMGSSPLLIQKGLTESLAGRFEIIFVTHWSFAEMREAFGWALDQFIYFGGYPGAAALITDQNRWTRYIRDSLIETSISRDVLLLNPVHKPALLRRMFQLGCEYSGRILSYQKMLGQLQDAGNTTTLAHYLDLLNGAGMLTGLHKFASARVRQRASSPKLQVYNNALTTAQMDLTFEEARKDTALWGQLVESAVGAHLLNTSVGTNIKVFYWREGDREVDFILGTGKAATAIEVKSGISKDSLPGMEAFAKEFKIKKKLLIGGNGIPLQDFLLQPAKEWI
jgi:uncharacterized protein